MTRWQRFKHAFETCRGPVVNRDYHPPTDREIKAWGPEGQRLVEEALYGVTLVRCRCEKCGRAFINRELGDQRGGES